MALTVDVVMQHRISEIEWRERFLWVPLEFQHVNIIMEQRFRSRNLYLTITKSASDPGINAPFLGYKPYYR